MIRFLTKPKNVAEDQKNLTGGGREKRFDSESPTPEFYVEKPTAARGRQRGHTAQSSSLHKMSAYTF